VDIDWFGCGWVRKGEGGAMARVGEEDPRWIVQEREDGQNVGGWHWQERDVLEWARGRVGELLAGGGGGGVEFPGVESLAGEAIINIRKGKFIAAFELELTGRWRVAGEQGGEGTFTVPYIGDEHEDGDECEVQVSGSEGPARETMLAAGRPLVKRALTAFLDELRSGGPMAGSSAASAEMARQGQAERQKTVLPSLHPSDLKAVAAPAAAPKEVGARANGGGAAVGGGRGVLEYTEKFSCRPEDLFDVLTNPPRMMAYTHAPATMEPRAGGKWTMFGGSVHGENVEFEPGRRLVQLWRFSTWEEGTYSRVEMDFSTDQEGVTVLKFKQTGIPEEDAHGSAVLPNTDAGWKDRIFKKVRSVFGFGC